MRVFILWCNACGSGACGGHRARIRMYVCFLRNGVGFLFVRPADRHESSQSMYLSFLSFALVEGTVLGSQSLVVLWSGVGCA